MESGTLTCHHQGPKNMHHKSKSFKQLKDNVVHSNISPSNAEEEVKFHFVVDDAQLTKLTHLMRSHI